MHVQVYVQVGPVSCIRPGDGRCLRNKWVLFFSPLHGGVNARPALKGMFPQPAPSCLRDALLSLSATSPREPLEGSEGLKKGTSPSTASCANPPSRASGGTMHDTMAKYSAVQACGYYEELVRY